MENGTIVFKGRAIEESYIYVLMDRKRSYINMDNMVSNIETLMHGGNCLTWVTLKGI